MLRDRLMRCRDERSTRRLRVWRMAYAGVLTALSLPLVVTINQEVGSQPGWWLLCFGVIPSIAVVIAAFTRPALAYGLALAHDVLLFGGLIALLLTLPNYFAFIFLAPLGAFIIEGLLLLCSCRIATRNEQS